MPTSPTVTTNPHPPSEQPISTPLDEAYDAVLEALRDLAEAPDENGRKTNLMRLASLHAARAANELEARIKLTGPATHA